MSMLPVSNQGVTGIRLFANSHQHLYSAYFNLICITKINFISTGLIGKDAANAFVKLGQLAEYKLVCVKSFASDKKPSMSI